jgi:predicted metalloprotease with PDZ domain
MHRLYRTDVGVPVSAALPAKSNWLCALIVVLVGTTLFGQCSLSSTHARKAVTYVFAPLFSGDSMALQVILSFNGGPNGTGRLKLPSRWGGQQYLEKSITELKAVSPGTRIIATSAPTEKELEFPPNGSVRISYILTKDWGGPLNSNTRLRADLSPDYFQIVGVDSLVHPAISESDTVDVNFDWQGLPANWSLATSFGSRDRCQSFHGLWRDVLAALFVGGDYRVHHTKMAGNSLDFAVRGKWEFTDETWIGEVRKIMSFERAFWHDNNFPYFLVTLTPFGQDDGSQAGVELTNGFMVHLSGRDKLTTNVLGTIAHETFHTWTPKRMGGLEGSADFISWFFEGFTAYYQDVMLFRSGLMTFPEYVSAMNAKVRSYEMTEGTSVDLREFIRQRSSDRSVLNQLDYRRGAIVATWLDATIRQKTADHASLDNVMADLVEQEAKHEHEHSGKPAVLTNKRIFRTASKYIGRGSTKELMRYVADGGSIHIPESGLGPCVRSDVEVLAKFDAGFDLSSISSGRSVALGVKPNGEAYKAGLRNGQELTRWSIYNGDPSKQVHLIVKSEDGDKVVNYYPLGEKVTIQQFTVDLHRYASSRRSCEAWLSGLAQPVEE